jgi:glycerophosphoryl diester phosphodiesterase
VPTKAIAHRGGSGLAPENTLTAFRQALAMGAHGLELDIHPTRDGHLAVIHDDLLERTTNGTGPVHLQDAAALQKLDAGGGDKVPLLEDVLDLLAPHHQLFVEIKHGPTPYEGVEELLVALLQRHDKLAQTVAISFNHATLAKLRRCAPELRTGLLFAYPLDFDEAEDLGVAYLGPHYKLVNPGLVGEAHRRGFSLNPWTVDDPPEMERLLDLGVGAITSDRPDLLIEAIRAWRIKSPL